MPCRFEMGEEEMGKKERIGGEEERGRGNIGHLKLSLLLQLAMPSCTSLCDLTYIFIQFPSAMPINLASYTSA